MREEMGWQEPLSTLGVSSNRFQSTEDEGLILRTLGISLFLGKRVIKVKLSGLVELRDIPLSGR